MRKDMLKRLLFPPKCAVCDTLLDWYDLPAHTALCEACGKLWESEKLDTCGICAKKVSECRCMTAEMEKAKCAAFRKLTYYHHGKRDSIPNRLIYHIKKTREARPHHFLAAELLPAFRDLLRECGDPEHAVLTFLPRGRSAWLQYGTDQAQELARALSKQSGIPFQRLIVRALRQSRAQKVLSPAERLQNAKLSFQIARGADVRGKTVFLVDDIVTTGAGMAVGTRLLRRAGANRVYCIAVASDDANK